MAHTIRDKEEAVEPGSEVRGQVEAVERLLENESECSEILQQIAACRGSINGLMSEVLEGHIRFHLVERRAETQITQGQRRGRSDHHRQVLFEVARKPCRTFKARSADIPAVVRNRRASGSPQGSLAPHLMSMTTKLMTMASNGRMESESPWWQWRPRWSGSQCVGALCPRQCHWHCGHADRNLSHSQRSLGKRTGAPDDDGTLDDHRHPGGTCNRPVLHRVDHCAVRADRGGARRTHGPARTHRDRDLLGPAAKQSDGSAEMAGPNSSVRPTSIQERSSRSIPEGVYRSTGK